MADLVVIVPSRGRPEAAAELVQSFAETCSADTQLVFAVDESDPRQPEYWDAAKPIWPGILPHDNHSMVEALNWSAVALTAVPTAGVNQFGGEPWSAPFALGFMGDDHRPRTKGWDQAYLDALRELGTGIVYGDDLYQGAKLPTQCAMTSDIVRALGYMSPPSLTHMYVDNFWLGLGRAAGCIRYLPDVVVEHMHPVAGKSEWTEGHKRVNDRAMYAKDEAAYLAYCSTQFSADVAKVAALRGAHV